MLQTGEFLKQEPGWRVATIDLSQLGSAPSFLFSKAAGLEQVFGWAWQGAVTARNIMLLNTGLKQQYYPFLFRSCVSLGATDLVVKEDVLTDPEAFYQAAAMAGYEIKQRFSNISIWKNIDRPYLIHRTPTCLAIGKYAGTIGLQFPEVEMGVSPFIDAYSLEQLERYPRLILSGATWNIKGQAEQLIRAYVRAGGQVFIEMAGMPPNILAKQPEFLGVYGEPVSLREEITIYGGETPIVLPVLPQKEGDWMTYVPMGLDKVELAFSYYGNEAPILGYKWIEGQKVWFLGANLSYYAFVDQGNASIQLLQAILGLNPTFTGDPLLPLLDYEASEHGYSLAYRLEQPAEMIVPISFMDGLQVKLDGQPLIVDNWENLLKLNLPAGTHNLEINIEKTAIFTWGKYLSLFTLFSLLITLIGLNRRGKVGERA